MSADIQVLVVDGAEPAASVPAVGVGLPR